MSTVNFTNPPSISKPPGYTHVVEISGPGKLIYIAGQLGLDVSGNIAGDFRAQAAQAFANLKNALAAAGAAPENVVKVNVYIVDIGKNLSIYREIRDQNLNMAAPPASTAIGVPELARQGALFEIEAIAAL